MVSSSLEMSFEKDLPRGWGKTCFHKSGVFQNLGRWSSLKHAYVSLELLQASAVGRNAHFYIKKQNRQHGHFGAAWHLSQPKVLSGEMCKCLRRVSLSTSIRGEPAGRRGALDSVLHPTRRAQAGNDCAGRNGSSVPLS